jgi:hypothetical protein
MSVYTENGYSNRREYLDSLRAEYVREIVDTLTSLFPSSEDFDGLVTHLEDHQELWDSGLR